MKPMLTALFVALAFAIATPAMAQQPGTPGASKADTAKKAATKAKKDDKAMPERANKGGAQRGEDRADQVRQMNQQRKGN